MDNAILEITIRKSHEIKNTRVSCEHSNFSFQVSRLQDFRRLSKELLLDVLDAIAEYMTSGQQMNAVVFTPQAEIADTRESNK